MRVDPHSYFDPEQGTVTGIKLDWKVNFEEKIISGRVTLFVKDHYTDFIDLDTRDLNIHSIYNHHGNLNWEMAPQEAILGSRLRVYLPTGEEYLHIEYETSSKSTALQWLEPEQTFGKQLPFLYSQCQALHARAMVPIQDSPGVRFTYTAAVAVPSQFKVAMSANLNSMIVFKGRSNYYFEMEQPIPAYLLALLVGNLSYEDLSERCRVYSEPEILKAAAWEFSDMEKMLQAAESLLGPYKWDRYDVAVLPPAFPYGGMENPRLTFLSPAIVCGDRSKLSTLNHEAAHSWSGNLVTNKTWEDFWLNEGLTTYVERRLVEAMEGRPAVWLHYAMGRIDLEAAFADFVEQPELTKLKPNLNGLDPDVVFSSVPYEKGCLFFFFLEMIAGRYRFDQFLRKYIETYKFQSITSEEFKRFLEEEMPAVAAEVRIDQWLHQPGLPRDTPIIVSDKLNRLQELAQTWNDGSRLNGAVAEAQSWSPNEWMIFLDKIIKLTDDDCEWLESIFNLSQIKNQDLLTVWFSKAIAAQHHSILPKVRNLLESTGRMFTLKDLFKSLCKNGKKDLAQQWYEELKYLYHPAARAYVEPLFD